MQYLLTPLHTHIDSGFGATGNAFSEAADTLESSFSDRKHLLNEFLPINYLRRHAIELFLKSAIVIIHRTLALPYGDTPPNGVPKALVDGTWIPFQRLHSVKSLWIYLKLLFQEQKEFFDSVKAVDWIFSPELDDWIENKSNPNSNKKNAKNKADCIWDDINKIQK